MIVRLIALTVAAFATAASATSYTAVALDRPGESTLFPEGLGPDGTVVGQTSDYLPVVRHPDGTRTILPTLGGPRGGIDAVNASGMLAGESRTGPTVQSNRPFVRSPSGVITIIPIPDGTVLGGARGINAAGEVVGEFSTADGYRAFTWDEMHGTTVLAQPGLSPRDTSGEGINTGGEVIGISYDRGFGPTEIVRWSAAGVATIVAEGDAANPFLKLGGMNDADIVVGATQTGGINPFLTRATVWDAAGHAIDAGFLPGDNTSMLSAINNHGVAVGFSATVDDNSLLTNVHLVSWTLAGGLQPLSLSGSLTSVLNRVLAINDRGQILAYSERGDPFAGTDVVDSAALLNPVAGVPDVSVWGEMIVGFAISGAGLRQRRRRGWSGSLSARGWNSLRRHVSMA